MNNTFETQPANRTKDSIGFLIAAAVCLSIVLFAISFYMLSHVSSNGVHWLTKYFVYAIFIGVPCLPLIAAGMLVWHRKKFGESSLSLNASPIKVGGELIGTVRVSKQLTGFDFIRLKVACLRLRGSGGQGGEELIAGIEQLVKSEQVILHSNGTAEMPVQLQIPANCPPSDSGFNLSGTQIQWVLKAEAFPNIGPHYCASFVLKVVAEN